MPDGEAGPLLLALRMLIAGCFVVLASRAAERAGPLVGALVATLPISAGPAYLFLALDHGPAFLAESALAIDHSTARVPAITANQAASARPRLSASPSRAADAE